MLTPQVTVLSLDKNVHLAPKYCALIDFRTGRLAMRGAYICRLGDHPWTGFRRAYGRSTRTQERRDSGVLSKASGWLAWGREPLEDIVQSDLLPTFIIDARRM